MLTIHLQETDPFVDNADVRVVEATADRAVVEQPALRHLDNHVGVRHASALFTAGYEAARALVRAALAEHGGPAEAELVASECAYVSVGWGLVTTTAVPAGGGWDDLALRDGAPAELAVDVESVDEEGKTVVTLSHRFTVGARAS